MHLFTAVALRLQPLAPSLQDVPPLRCPLTSALPSALFVVIGLASNVILIVYFDIFITCFTTLFLFIIVSMCVVTPSCKLILYRF